MGAGMSTQQRWLVGFYALVAVAAVFVWQALNVRLNYGGEWNALFLAGERFPVPAALAQETIPQLPGSDG